MPGDLSICAQRVFVSHRRNPENPILGHGVAVEWKCKPKSAAFLDAGLFTVTVAEPTTPSAVAVIRAVPLFIAVARPSLSTIATEGASEFQVKLTPVITFPRASFAVALNW